MPKKTSKKKTKSKKEEPTYRKATYPSARRCAHLVKDFPISSIGKELKGVCQQFGVREQTILRDIKVLNEEFQTEDGQDIFCIEKRGDTKWMVRRPTPSDLSEAHIDHLVSMYFALEYFKILEGKIIADPIEQMMGKIEKMVPKTQRGLIHELPRKFYAAPSPHKDYSSDDCADIIEDVIYSIVHQMEVSIFYKRLDQDEPQWRKVQPLTLLYHRGSLYLIAIKKGYKNPVYFNIERIKEIKLHREDRFEYPKKYDPKQMLDGAFGVFGQKDNVKTFRIKFPPELKEYIMYWHVHDTQEFEEQKDGSVVLTMKVTDSEEVRSWVRSFGKLVKMTVSHQ